MRQNKRVISALEWLILKLRRERDHGRKLAAGCRTAKERKLSCVTAAAIAASGTSRNVSADNLSLGVLAQRKLFEVGLEIQFDYFFSPTVKSNSLLPFFLKKKIRRRRYS